ncbi:hypothetical protein TB2_035788 [Malus domestica]|uniref:proteasome subunit alpha type-7-like n=1 Tax=Malus sylvestris TaxID=3752 RepID=UPI0021ABE5BE|nr:proteasome subunit alpha type-7-like [Malus sylvestris]
MLETGIAVPVKNAVGGCEVSLQTMRNSSLSWQPSDIPKGYGIDKFPHLFGQPGKACAAAAAAAAKNTNNPTKETSWIRIPVRVEVVLAGSNSYLQVYIPSKSGSLPSLSHFVSTTSPLAVVPLSNVVLPVVILANSRGRRRKEREGGSLGGAAERSGQETVKLAIWALLEVVESGGKHIEVAVMTKDHGLKQLEEAEIDAIVVDIEAEKASAMAAKNGPPRET